MWLSRPQRGEGAGPQIEGEGGCNALYEALYMQSSQFHLFLIRIMRE